MTDETATLKIVIEATEISKFYYKCECGCEYHNVGANYCGSCGRNIKKSAE